MSKDNPAGLSIFALQGLQAKRCTRLCRSLVKGNGHKPKEEKEQ
jgi:hypothetical protein